MNRSAYRSSSMIEFDRSPNGYLELHVSGTVDIDDVDRAASWLGGVLSAGVSLSFYLDLAAVENIEADAIGAASKRFASLADGARFVERIALVVERRHARAFEPLTRSLPPRTTVRRFADDETASARRWLLEAAAVRRGALRAARESSVEGALRHSSRRAGCLAACVLAGQLAAPAPAAAEEAGAPWSLSLGAGALLAPLHLGDDELGLIGIPNLTLRYGERFSIEGLEGLSYRLVRGERLSASVSLGYGAGRDEDGDSPLRLAGGTTRDLEGLGDIDGTAVVGGKLTYREGSLSANISLRRALGSHEGTVIDFGLGWSTMTMALGPPLIVSGGPRLTLADDAWTGAFFGIDAAQSAASGLAEHQAGAGLLSAGVGVSLVLPLSARTSLVGIGGYARLTGEAADSPLVRERGSVDQGTIGLIWSYRFGGESGQGAPPGAS